VATLGSQQHLILSTPGTDRCADPTQSFAVSVIFDPGEYFAAALADFAGGKLTMGVAREWHLGKDPVPTVKLCHGTAAQNQALSTFIRKVGAGTINPDTEVAKLGR
jgi:basic membrane protein A